MNLLEFASAWLLGVLTTSMTNDSSAIAQCRMTLLDLEKELEKKPKDENEYAKQIREIKNILKILNAQQAGLFIKNRHLEKLIGESLEKIRCWETGRNEGVNYVSFVSVALCEIWGIHRPSS